MIREYLWLAPVSFGLGFAALIITGMDHAVIPIGDRLTFVATLLGVAGAVFGAIAVENYKSSMQRRDDRRRLTAAIDKVGFALVYGRLDNPGLPDDEAERIIWRLKTLDRAAKAFAYAVNRVVIDDMHLYEALQYAIDEHAAARGSIDAIRSDMLTVPLDPARVQEAKEWLGGHLYIWDIALSRCRRILAG